MLPIIQIGPLAIQTPGLALLIGVWLGLSLAERRAHVYRVSANHLYNLAFIALLGGILGARLVYIVRFWNVFAASPASIISLNPGLFDPFGGVVLGTIGAMAYGQRKRMPLWPTLDALTPALAVVAVAIGAARLASGVGYGLPTRVPWAIELWGASRHPTQFYEILAATAILILLFGRRWLDLAKEPGTSFLSFLALQSFAWIAIEGLRADSAIMAFGLRAAQVVAWILLALSLTMLNFRPNVTQKRTAKSRGG